MAYKATIDIAVNFSYLKVRLLNRQGFIRYRMRIYWLNDEEKFPFHPYRIIKSEPSFFFPTQNLPQVITNSELDSISSTYLSRLIPVRFRNDNIFENQTVLFQTQVETDKLDSTKFFCEVECQFSEEPMKNFEKLTTFKAAIRKVYNVSTYLPIAFDELEGFCIASSFHGIIMQFKYDSSNNDKKKNEELTTEKKFYDLWSYMDSITSGFRKEETKQFYEYYRSFLEHELYKLQQRHSQLLKKQAQIQKKEDFLESYKFIKMIKNKEILRNIENMKSRKLITISTTEQEKLVQLMMDDFASLKSYSQKKWIQFIDWVHNNSLFVSKLYRKTYKSMCNERLKNNVFSHRIKNHDWRYARYEDSGKSHLEQANKAKKKILTENQLWNEYFPIESCSYFAKSQNTIKMFEEVYETDKKSEKVEKKEKHFIILVHGFQATRQDFDLLKSCLQLNYPMVQVFVSSCNEGLTEQNFENLGKRLAVQTTKILNSTNKKNFRLSFIGHSLGGLIIRSALPYLKQFSEKFYTYISLSSPHLGYLYRPSTFVRAGLWFMNRWQKCDSLNQINMKDGQTVRQTKLFQLSKNGSLNNFKKICFMASSQDEYVTYESARIQENSALASRIEKDMNHLIHQMIGNILNDVTCSQISRINVVFDIPDKNFDSLIGRTGHVKFLSDIQFIRQFCFCFDKFFA